VSIGQPLVLMGGILACRGTSRGRSVARLRSTRHNQRAIAFVPMRIAPRETPRSPPWPPGLSRRDSSSSPFVFHILDAPARRMQPGTNRCCLLPTSEVTIFDGAGWGTQSHCYGIGIIADSFQIPLRAREFLLRHIGHGVGDAGLFQ
jgi:hypothetical protein